MESFPFSECIDFLKKFDFLFKHRNIDYFFDGVYSQIPQEWISYLSELPYSEHGKLSSRDSIPPSLSSFVESSLSFSLLGEPSTSEMSSLSIDKKKLKAKKVHELTAFSGLIRQKCAEMRVTRIVDIGCGLGHLLSSLQNEENELELVGVECDVALCTNGAQRYDGIHYENILLNFDSSNEDCERILSPEGHRTAIISLHGCGDLQPLIIRKYSELKGEKNPLLMTIACCYHKMNVIDIPLMDWCMSPLLIDSIDRSFVLPAPALRLACQQRLSSLDCMTDEEHEEHERQFFYRACLEVYLKQKFPLLSRLPRGSTRIPVRISQIDHFTSILPKLGVISEDAIASEIVHFEKIIDRYRPMIHTIEAFTTLQFYMQSVLESLILADRALFLSHSPLLAQSISVQLTPIFDSHFSPRNMVLTASSRMPLAL